MKFFLILVFIGASTASAITPLSVEELKDRFQLNADIFEVDATGKKLLAQLGDNHWESSDRSGKISGVWSTNLEKNLIALKHEWLVQEDGTIKVSITELEKEQAKPGTRDTEFTNPLKSQEFILENFQPVVWNVLNIKDRHVIVRYVPSLKPSRKLLTLKELPIAGSDIQITDSDGYLWASDLKFYEAKYAGVTTHRGTVLMSYAPFKGAKDVGLAQENRIELRFDKNYLITLQSRTSFLPAGLQAKVYALYRPDIKTERLRSVHSFDSNNEDRFLNSIKK